ncbi:acid protease [Trametes cingulata]|nr:acid protease [Trametes cingulata]
MSFSFFRGLPLALSFFSYLFVVEAQNAGASYGSVKTPVDIGLHDLLDGGYTIDIVLGGQSENLVEVGPGAVDTDPSCLPDFTVILDTGSSDLWVNTKGLNLQVTNTTDLQTDNTYAIGDVRGNIAFAELRIGPYVIPHQAFTNASEVSDMPGDIAGLMGIAFDSLSPITTNISLAWGLEAGKELGRTPITNLISQDPSVPGYFDLELGRLDENGTQQNGHFYIGQHMPGAESVANAPKLERISAEHWTVVMDGAKVNGQPFAFNKSSVKGVPDGKVAAVFDSGFTYSQFPSALVNAIYGSIPGAVPYSGAIPGTDNGAGNNWIVPCNASANISFTFAGQEFAVHPRDVIIPNTAIELQKIDGVSILANTTVCTNRFFEGEPVGEYDILLGMGFLRNVYASFQYGDYNWPGINSTGQLPYVQLLSVTEPEAAWAEFTSFSAQQLASGPPALDPATFVRFLTDYNSSTSQSHTSATTAPTTVAGPSASGSADPSASTSTSAASGQAEAAVDLAVSGAASSDDGSSEDSDSKKYGPIALGLLGANVAVGLAVLGITLALCVRGSKERREARYKPIRLPKENMSVDPERGPLYTD